MRSIRSARRPLRSWRPKSTAAKLLSPKEAGVVGMGCPCRAEPVSAERRTKVWPGRSRVVRAGGRIAPFTPGAGVGTGPDDGWQELQSQNLQPRTLGWTTANCLPTWSNLRVGGEGAGPCKGDYPLTLGPSPPRGEGGRHEN